jgi:SAM-dependent methyltransferase
MERSAASHRRERLDLVFRSFAMLFMELALIRWVSAYDVYVAYFTNFVLLASFLGIGVGFLRSRTTRDRSELTPRGLAIVAGFVLVFPVIAGRNSIGRTFTGLLGLRALPPWVMLPLTFLLVVAAMALVAEAVGRRFELFEPLEAYRLDILGSLAGIVVFSLLSFAEARPVVWGVIIATAFVVGRMLATRVARVWAAVVVLILLVGSISPLDHWSPYYRVTVGRTSADGGVAIRVNGLPHQGVLPLDLLRTEQPFYLQPYDHLGGRPPGDVLIIGAGSGNDVAVALSMGASHVDAVEIDPVLQATGRTRHPDHPYQDPRVNAIIDDGRAFLEQTDTRYDLILFALPDSLTLVSGQGSLRLESYLFTREAMQAIRDHLRRGGVFSMYNYYRPFVFERFAGTMADVFGHEPCFDAGEESIGPRQQAVLTLGLAQDDITCSTPWTPTQILPAPATDDHPFPYVPGRSIPVFYLVALGLIVLASVVIVRAAGGPVRSIGPFVDLFFMGAAFLLLETKNVVQFALLFGTTWFVNSLVFAGILLAVLAAVEVARRFRLPDRRLLYGLLGASLVVAYAVPPGALLDLAVVPRFAAAVSLAFAPVFLANLIFSQRFRDVGASTVAFGANLLGAMVGGVLEYGALVVGYRNLLVLVALLYGFAFVTGRRYLGATDHAVDAVDARATSPLGSRPGG